MRAPWSKYDAQMLSVVDHCRRSAGM